MCQRLAPSPENEMARSGARLGINVRRAWIMQGKIEILINGQKKAVLDSFTIAELLHHLELRETQVAVEVNREIVRRADWNKRQLRGGDEVEIVHFVGGGEGGSWVTN